MHAAQDAEKRRDVLTEQNCELIPEWSMAPVVTALQTMRGVAMVIAVTLVAEVGDLAQRSAFSSRRSSNSERMPKISVCFC
jgi:transposase